MYLYPIPHGHPPSSSHPPLILIDTPTAQIANSRVSRLDYMAETVGVVSGGGAVIQPRKKVLCRLTALTKILGADRISILYATRMTYKPSPGGP